MAVTDTADKPARGRPQLHDDDEILGAAIGAFAEVGYEAMSIRSLGRDLGLSHGALNQRFGSKERLFYAAVDHGFGSLAEATATHLARWPEPTDALDTLRNGIRAFLLASADHPEIVRLMNTLGITSSKRLDYVFEQFVEPMIAPLRRAALTARPSAMSEISTRELFFLVAHGAAAPFTLRGLSAHFDTSDGVLDAEIYAEHMAELVLRTLGI
jgi:AcrR family transcriptional regulator